MSESKSYEQFAEQPALDGLAVQRRARRLSRAAQAKADLENAPADELPIARVVLDVQTPHLGGFFDYIVPQKYSLIAQPGTMVRVRFGSQRHTGVIWERVNTSNALYSSLKSIELVLGKTPQINASTRADIDEIAKYFGGSRANIVRLAVPPRVAKVEQEIARIQRQSSLGHDKEIDVLRDEVVQWETIQSKRILHNYDGAAELEKLIQVSRTSNQVVWDMLPGATRWCDDLAWAVIKARQAGRQVAIIVPDMRQVTDVVMALERAGMTQLKDTTDTADSQDSRISRSWRGNFVVLNAALSSNHRYRSYMAVAHSLVGCVIGTRAAMYAPVADNSLFITFHEDIYQNWDGFTPYPNVRDVVNIRASRGNSLVIHAGFVRSSTTQWYAEQHGRTVLQVTPQPYALDELSPWIRHLNRAELERLADPAIGARVPSVAVQVLRKAVENGPVLLSIPARSQSQVLCCATCRKLAACSRCMGPLGAGNAASNGKPVCRWCSAVSLNWTCKNCGNSRIRVLHVGTQGTAQELSTLIPGIPVITSTPDQPRGVVEQISNRPSLVIATPGHEPRVTDRETGEFTGYASVALIDAWASLYGSSLDRRNDAVMNWARAAALCVSRSKGGQVLIIGETESVMAQTLMTWNPQILAHREVSDAADAGLPPQTAAALVWGEKCAVEQVISDVNREMGGLPVIDSTEGELPAVLGPVPKAVPQTMKQNYIDGMNERAQCVIRVPHGVRDKLTDALRHAAAKHSAQRKPLELHVHINPKNLL